MDELICPFCGRNDFKNKQGYSTHINNCKHNPNRKQRKPFSAESNLRRSIALKNKPKSNETKRKMSEAQKGHLVSDETKKKLSEANKGHITSDETKKKLSESQKGRVTSDETKRKISEAQKGENGYWYGKHQTIESNNKRSDTLKEYHKTHTISDETRKKLSEANKGHIISEECKHRISEANKGHITSDETRKKLSDKAKIFRNDPTVILKEYNTKKRNNSFNTSKIETELKNYFDSNNIEYISQYKSELYPFCCDFYFPDKDLYVEIQGSWTHGGKPYDETDPDCIKQLEIWKLKNTKFYDNAIKTWTVRDVKKREIAKQNKLNWIEIFSNKLSICLKLLNL